SYSSLEGGNGLLVPLIVEVNLAQLEVGFGKFRIKLEGFLEQLDGLHPVAFCVPGPSQETHGIQIMRIGVLGLEQRVFLKFFAEPTTREQIIMVRQENESPSEKEIPNVRFGRNVDRDPQSSDRLFELISRKVNRRQPEMQFESPGKPARGAREYFLSQIEVSVGEKFVAQGKPVLLLFGREMYGSLVGLDGLVV